MFVSKCTSAYVYTYPCMSTRTHIHANAHEELCEPQASKIPVYPRVAEVAQVRTRSYEILPAAQLIPARVVAGVHIFYQARYGSSVSKRDIYTPKSTFMIVIYAFIFIY